MLISLNINDISLNSGINFFHLVRDPFVWEFLLMLLQDPDFNPSHIKWEDEPNGVFKLVQKEEVAREWGERTEKHKQAPLTYGHFSRSLR